MNDSLNSQFNSLLRPKTSLFQRAGNSFVTHCGCSDILDPFTALARRNPKIPCFFPANREISGDQRSARQAIWLLPNTSYATDRLCLVLCIRRQPD